MPVADSGKTGHVNIELAAKSFEPLDQFQSFCTELHESPFSGREAHGRKRERPAGNPPIGSGALSTDPKPTLAEALN
jgi:hypothetical protein